MTPRPDPAGRHQRLAIALTLVIALAIGFGTLAPDTGSAPRVPHLDKLLHFLAFLGLVLPLATVLPRRSAVIGTVVLAVAYGGAIELIQPRFGRGAEWLDFWADLAGAAAGAALGRWLHPSLGGRPAADPRRA
jgi:VanZ family protein